MGGCTCGIQVEYIVILMRSSKSTNANTMAREFIIDVVWLIRTIMCTVVPLLELLTTTRRCRIRYDASNPLIPSCWVTPKKHARWIEGAPNYSEDYAVAGGNLGLQDSCAG